MYTVASLIERAVRLDPPAAHAMTRIARDVVNSLRGRTYAPPVVGVPAVRLPSDRVLLEGLLNSARPTDWPDEEALAAAKIALASPLDIAPLPDGKTATPGRRIRQVALICAISVDEEIWIGVGRLSVEQTAGRKPWSHDAGIAVEWYADLDAACDALEALYLEAPSHAGLPKLPRAWWIGGGSGAAAAVPEDWTTQVAAVGRIAGYDIEVIEAVGARLELPDRIANEQPACLIDWRAYTTGKPQAIVSRYQRDAPNGLYIPLGGAVAFDEALSLLRGRLHEQALAKVARPEIADGEPSTVEEAVQVAIKECKNLVFLDKALLSAKKSEYPRPALVLNHLRTLDDVVAAWRTGEINSDGFATTLADRGVSSYRPGISETAIGKFKADYERIYRGTRIDLGPHIASGVGSITRIMRIYWWVDRDEQTFVVGHIGCKLRDRSNH